MKFNRSIISLVFASLALCGASALSAVKNVEVAEAAVGSYTTNATTFYSGITATEGEELLGEVHDLMVTNHRTYTTYKQCYAGEEINATDPGSKTGYIQDFYTKTDYPAAQTISTGSVGWNREHVWCQSLSNNLWGETGGGGDIHHIRPEDSKSNNDRGNIPYGEAGSSPTVVKSAYDSAIAGYTNGNEAFEPIDECKGDVARIVMYVYTHYNTYRNVGGETNGSGNSSYFGTLDITKIMAPSSEAECWSLLLKWNKADPVSQSEKTRNEAAASITGTRNAFIDHPEYADAIWGGIPLGSGNSETEGTEAIGGTDTIDIDATGVTASSYTDATVVGKSGARYKVNCAKNSSYNCIQIRSSSSNTGMVSFMSGGTIKKVSVDWNSSSGSTATLNVYGSNTAYSSPSDLYDGSKYGTLIGSIKKGTTELEVSDNYAYVGVRSNSGAIYLNSVSFTWKSLSNPGDFLTKNTTKASLKFNYDKETITSETTKQYKKVTDSLTDYSGTYLIVNDSSKVALNGSLKSFDVSDNVVSVDINSSSIVHSADLEKSQFTITKSGSSYTIKSASGYYIGMSSNSKGLESSTSNSYTNSISVSNGNATIISKSSYLRYNNATSSGNRFRYYTSSTSCLAVSLYKLEGSTTATTTYTCSDVCLRFGAVISYSSWETLTSEANVTGYGVFAVVASKIDKTIEEIYKESGKSVSDNSWLTSSAYSIYHVTARGEESTLPLYRCDSTGNEESDTGDYIRWNLRFDVSNSAIKKTMAAVAYVIVDGEYVFLGQRSESVKSLAATYLSNGTDTNADVRAALGVLANWA